MAEVEDKILVQELLQRNLINQEKLAKIKDVALASLKTDGITKTLLKFLTIDEIKIAEIIYEKFNIPQIRKLNGLSYANVPGLPMDELLTDFKIIPIINESNELTIAIINPPYKKTIDVLKKITNQHIVPVVVKASDFDKIINNSQQKIEQIPSLNVDFDDIDVTKLGEQWAQKLEVSANLPPATKVVDKIIKTAVETGTSDIHFEISAKGFLNIRFRINNVLQRIVTLPQQYTTSITSILKQSGTVDSFGRKNIQQGQRVFTFHGKKIPTRINIIPTNTGEKITFRILKEGLQIKRIDELGLSIPDFQRFKKLLSYSNAIILFVGPSGCGKTTSMYAALNELNDKSRNIATIENPIECSIDDINQTAVDIGRDINFTNGIKALFHHDVDILGVGEIRNKEESELLIEAGLTGMLACTTLQATDAIKSIYRLKNLGIKTEELALVIQGIVAQRFVRKVCPFCTQEYQPGRDILEKAGLLNISNNKITFRKGTGCKTCLGSGYLNRIPIFEILLVNETMSSLIYRNASYREIKMAAEKNGFTTMRYDGIRKALSGITTLDEVIRVT